MREGWARALTTVGAARPPSRGEPLRIVTQGSVDGDGVSEAGLPAAAVRALFEGFLDLEVVEVANLPALTPDGLRSQGRRVVLVSNQRARYGSCGLLEPDLHLVLWNPFQVLDVAAPAVVTWGHGEGARAALKAWLNGRSAAPGVPPVALDRD
jgi:beta-N-acetylhexosaminidase